MNIVRSAEICSFIVNVHDHSEKNISRNRFVQPFYSGADRYSATNFCICSEPTKLDRFWLEFSAPIPWLGGAESMKASKFSDAQKAFILKQGSDGVPVADICRKAGISQATYFNWKKKLDRLLRTEMRRLKQLEDENSKLKKLVADLSLDREMLQDVIRRKL